MQFGALLLVLLEEILSYEVTHCSATEAIESWNSRFRICRCSLSRQRTTKALTRLL